MCVKCYSFLRYELKSACIQGIYVSELFKNQLQKLGNESFVVSRRNL